MGPKYDLVAIVATKDIPYAKANKVLGTSLCGLMFLNFFQSLSCFETKL